MLRSKIKENPRLTYLLSALPFLFSAIDGFTTGAIFLASVNIIGVVGNLVAFQFYQRLPATVPLYFSALNALISFMLSYHYFELGKSGLPYAWIVAGLFNLVAGFMIYRKHASAS